MTQKFLFGLVIFISGTLMLNCSKDEEELPAGDLIYNSLFSERDTIAPGETTNVTAVAIGNGLTYYWSATLGDILGSGSEVVYAASPCQTGINQITCKITDRNNQSESKTIDIVVYE